MYGKKTPLLDLGHWSRSPDGDPGTPCYEQSLPDGRLSPSDGDTDPPVLVFRRAHVPLGPVRRHAPPNTVSNCIIIPRIAESHLITGAENLAILALFAHVCLCVLPL